MATLATLWPALGAAAATQQQQAVDSTTHVLPHAAVAVCAERHGCEGRQAGAAAAQLGKSAVVAPRLDGVQPRGATRPEWLAWVPARVGGFLLPLVFWRRNDGRLIGERL